MTDTEILNWLQDRLESFRQTVNDNMEPEKYSLSWFSDKGFIHDTYGASLRECVENANNEMQTRKS